MGYQQLSLFPELQFEHLYVLGNGFDLAHHLKTSYHDFRDWMLHNNLVNAFMLMDFLHDGRRNMLWSIFEKALGEMDLDLIKKANIGNLYIYYDIDRNCLFPVIADIDVFTNLGRYFSHWANEVNETLKSIEPIFKFKDRSLFITFNYTDTLEMVYHVPERMVQHINGRASSEEKVVIGHNRNVDCSVVFSGHPNNIMEENEYYQNLYNYSQLKKNGFRQVYNMTESFKKGLLEVKDIHVIGHSFEDVDYDYFISIKDLLPADVMWNLFYHTDDDKLKMNHFIHNLQLNHMKIKKL